MDVCTGCGRRLSQMEISYVRLTVLPLIELRIDIIAVDGSCLLNLVWKRLRLTVPAYWFKNWTMQLANLLLLNWELQGQCSQWLNKAKTKQEIEHALVHPNNKFMPVHFDSQYVHVCASTVCCHCPSFGPYYWVCPSCVRLCPCPQSVPMHCHGLCLSFLLFHVYPFPLCPTPLCVMSLDL